MTAPYPLLFEPILMEKVWGGDRLARFGKRVERGAKVGESWEVADLASTASSGAGGGAQRSVIVNGTLAGKTLRDAMLAWPGQMLGGRRADAFPLLVKFLDAKEHLSVQVHPSPAYAAAHAEAHLKTEAWYILDAAPGSVIYKGIKPGVTRDAFARAIAAGTVEACMVAAPARVGECHNLPSGTCHALGAGVLVAEVQTPSDTTFRVYDWGRTGRELHIEQSLECIHFGPAPQGVMLKNPSGGFGPTLATEFFVLRHLSLNPGATQAITDAPRCTIVMVLSGSGSLSGTDLEPMRIAAGNTVLIPAGVAASATIGTSQGVECLIAQVP